MSTTILVTGGTGLVGSQLIESLIEQGHYPRDIRALVRGQSDTSLLDAKGVRLCRGDVTDAASIQAGMDGVHTVFHCAASVDEKRRDLFWRVNYEGTVQVLDAARRAGVSRFVHVSTTGAYGLLQQWPATEDHPKDPLRPYAAAKLAAEEKVREFWQVHGLKTVVLRPTLIVGERDRTISKRLVHLARKRIVPVVGGGKSRVSFVDVKDLTRALILAAQREVAVGKVYNVEGFSAPIREVIELVVHLTGSRARIIDVPYSLAYGPALIIDGFYALARPTHHPVRARKGLQQLTRDMVFDTTRIRTDLDFEPRCGMVESFQAAIRWQLEHGG